MKSIFQVLVIFRFPILNELEFQCGFISRKYFQRVVANEKFYNRYIRYIKLSINMSYININVCACTHKPCMQFLYRYRMCGLQFLPHVTKSINSKSINVIKCHLTCVLTFQVARWCMCICISRVTLKHYIILKRQNSKIFSII